MKRRVITWLFPSLLLVALAQIASADLQTDLRAILNDKSLKPDKIGVEVIQLGDSKSESKTIFQHNANAPLIPASNMKLVTTAGALEILGRDYRFRTLLVHRGDDVAIVGDGDPTLGDAEMLRKVGWDVNTVFQNWADVLKQRRIASIRNLYIDDSVFDQVFLHPNWPIEQQHKRYAPQVGGLNLNANCVNFFLGYNGRGNRVTYRTDPVTKYITIENTCVGGAENAVWLSRRPLSNTVVLRGQTNASNVEPISVTVHDPSMYAGTVFAETLQGAGITLHGQIARDGSIRQALLDGVGGAETWRVLAIHETSISTVLGRANKDSVNLYAEALCKRIGHASSGNSGSWTSGTAAMGAFLQSMGVKPSEFTLDDGSGLSKKNAVSANSFARVLEHVFHGANRQTFIESLAVAGSDGTLEKRFRSLNMKGRVYAKSGYVAGVSALSGYIQTESDTWYAFSIVMNGVRDLGAAKRVQERLVSRIDREASLSAHSN